MRLVSIFLACGPIFLASSSRCPEPKKPHLTSCTIFYSCANLPGGGYVWIPSKCTEGLVFQPYLRMCVVPGDIWTCDTLSTVRAHTFDVTNKYETPELLEPTDASYSEYTQEDPFSEVIDSSYVIDDFSDESTTEAVTAYPLIEFEQPDVATPAYHNEDKNHLYKYTNSQSQVPSSLIEEYQSIVDSHSKCLNELINRLRNYKQLAAISNSLSNLGDITTVKPTRTIAIFASHNRERNVTLNYLVQSYAEGNGLHNDKPAGMKEDVGPQLDNIAPTLDNVTFSASTLASLIDSLDSDNNIIRIGDNLGNKQYLTIDGYKAVANRLTSRFIAVVACTKNVRLPNGTDCNRYYTCDPKTASVVEFSCPLHTAFNVHSRICDVESAKTCGNKLAINNDVFVERREKTTTMYPDEKFLQHSSEETLCREPGKMKDPTSDSHYYICYSVSGSEDVKSIRMSCPNVLIFCQSKKVCTTRQLCDMSR